MLSAALSSARRARRFLADAGGVSAVEFALALPLVMMLFLGGYETANYVRVSLRVATAANSVAEMLSQAPASASATVPGNGLLTGQQYHFYYDSTMFTIPDSLDESNRVGMNWYNLAQVTMWNIEFKQTAPNVYTPVVVWSSSGGPACAATITQVPNDSMITASTLPVSVYGPGSLLVVQIQYLYYPIFASAFFGPSTITRTAMMAPRNVPVVEANDTADNIQNCPGTPF